MEKSSQMETLKDSVKTIRGALKDDPLVLAAVGGKEPSAYNPTLCSHQVPGSLKLRQIPLGVGFLKANTQMWSNSSTIF